MARESRRTVALSSAQNLDRWLLALCLTGCGSRGLSLDVAGEAAVVSGVDDRGVRSATPLLSAGERLDFEISGADGWISVSSWNTVELGPLAVLVGDSAPFRQAVGCEPQLPPPSLHKAYDLEGGELDKEPPVLAGGRIESACPPARLAFELSYGELGPRCEPRLTERGCSADVDLSECGLGTASMSYDPVGGRVCLRATKSCTPLDSHEETSSAEARCVQSSGDSVGLTVHSVPAPRFEVVQRVVVDHEASAPNLDGVEVEPGVLRLGRLVSIARREDLVAVAKTPLPEARCLDGTGTFLGLDAQTLETRFETSTRCIFSMLPTREGWVAVTVVPGEMRIVELDLRGVVTSTLAEFGPSGIPRIVLRDGLLAYSVNVLDVDNMSGIWVGTIDLTTRQTRRSFVSHGRDPDVTLVGDRIAALDNSHDEVLWFPLDLSRDPVAVLLRPRQFGKASTQIFAFGAEALVLTEYEQPAVHLVTEVDDVSRAPMYEGPGDAVSLLALESTALVGGVTAYGAERRGLVTELQPQRTRYILGAADVGEGPVTQLVSDGEGGALGLLPWEGSIVRIRRVGGEPL